MPISVEALMRRTANVSIDYGDAGTLSVSYYPARMNEKVLKAASSVKYDTPLLKAARIVNDTLIALVASWDLLDDSGNVVALTQDALGDVPFDVRVEVLRRITGGDAEAIAAVVPEVRKGA